MLRFLTAGESHGPAEIAILEGMPAGLSISVADIDADLKKRHGGYGRGGRGKIETDQVNILSGVRFGKTLGSPICLLIKNLDFKNWQEKMASQQPLQGRPLLKAETKPRPGHADLAGALKYQTDDVRNVLERASARETVMRVAVGTICRRFLGQFGIEVASHTVQIGKVKIERQELRVKNHEEYFSKIKKVFITDPDIRCINKEISTKMHQQIRTAIINKDTLGGVVEVIAHKVPAGLGSHVHWDRKIDGRIAQALVSIPSVKGVEIGDAISSSSRYGSEVQDEIFYRRPLIYRQTNRMGGVEGGITNGEDIVVRVYHKPLSTLGKPLRTVDLITKKPARALIERTDVCVVPRAGVISEAMLAFILADAMLEKFGGDTIRETKRNFEVYKKWIKSH